MATWKDEAALASHMKEPYVSRFFQTIKKYDIKIELNKFKSALA